MRGRVRLEVSGLRVAEVPATPTSGPRLAIADVELDDDDVQELADELEDYLAERGRRR